MLQKRRYLISALLLLISITSFAQQNNTGAIKGFVYDKKTGEPLIYTAVRLLGTKYGAQTDVNGYYSIPQLPPGTYQLFTTLVGYDTDKVYISVKAGQVISQKLSISAKERELTGVEISARKTEKITHIDAGTTTITPREIKSLPSVGGEPDVTQFLQVVPGVVFTGDQGGQLYIRGGSPSQTGILLDGVTIYNPFHSIGLFSVFETDAIRSVDVQSAGFNAEHGNRTSAILDIHTIDGNKNRTEGLVSVSPFMTRAMLQGPIKKAKKDNGASITYVLSFKDSYLDQTSKSIYGGLGEPFKSGLPYSFTDFYGKVSVIGENGSKVNAFGFNFTDNAQLLDPTTNNEAADFKWTATGGGATFVVSPSGSSTLIDGKFAYSSYNITDNEVGYNQRSSGINGFETGINLTNFLPGFSELKYGLEVSGFNTTLNYYNGFGYSTVLDRQNTLAGVYVMWRKDFSDKFVMEPSIRFQYYSELSKISPEPRLGLKYNISENVRLKFATGIYTQDIISTKSDRDIVNFFTGFLLSPDQTVKNTNGDPLNANLQKAYHVLGGLEVDLNKVELNLEPWYKNFVQDIVLNRDKQYATDPDFTSGTGKAYGVDLSAKYSENRLYLWGVASYQQVNYNNIGPDGTPQTYPAAFDRRFNLNMLGSYTAGKRRDWEISLRYNLGSPFPFTQTQGFYENINMAPNGNIGANYLTANGSIGTLYASEINGGRLSWYHRLDASVKKNFRLSKNSLLDATASITNVYDRNNIFYVNRLTNTRVYQLPLIPSLNLTWHF